MTFSVNGHVSNWWSMWYVVFQCSTLGRWRFIFKFSLVGYERKTGQFRAPGEHSPGQRSKNPDCIQLRLCRPRSHSQCFEFTSMRNRTLTLIVIMSARKLMENINKHQCFNKEQQQHTYTHTLARAHSHKCTHSHEYRHHGEETSDYE